MKKKSDDLKPYKLFGLSIIQFMSLLAIAAVLLTVLLQHYFPMLGK